MYKKTYLHIVSDGNGKQTTWTIHLKFTSAVPFVKLALLDLIYPYIYYAMWYKCKQFTHIYIVLCGINGKYLFFIVIFMQLRFWDFILYLYFFSIIVSHLYLHFINWKRPWPWVWEFPSDWFLQWSWTKAAAEGRASLVKITLPCSYRWYSLNGIFLSFLSYFVLIWKWFYHLFINTNNNDILWMLHLYLSLYSSISIGICIPPCYNLFFNQFVKTKIKLHLWKSSNQPPCWFTTQFGDGIAVPVFSLCRCMTL